MRVKIGLAYLLSRVKMWYDVDFHLNFDFGAYGHYIFRSYINKPKLLSLHGSLSKNAVLDTYHQKHLMSFDGTVGYSVTA